MEINPESEPVMIDKRDRMNSENNGDERMKKDENKMDQDKEKEGEVGEEAATRHL